MNQTTTRGPVSIRRATTGDANDYRLLRLEALRTNPEAFSGDIETTINLTEEEWDLRTKKAAISEEMAIFFAEHEGELVGMSGIRLGNSEKTRHSGLLFSVFVKPGWRGLQIGARLIQACVSWAGEQKVRVIYLGVNATNTSAIRCYTQNGFSVHGLEAEALKVEDKYYDLLLMTRRL